MSKILISGLVSVLLMAFGAYLKYQWGEFKDFKSEKAQLEQRVKNEVAEKERIAKEAEQAREAQLELKAAVKKEKDFAGVREKRLREKEVENEALASLLTECRISVDSLRR